MIILVNGTGHGNGRDKRREPDPQTKKSVTKSLGGMLYDDLFDTL